MPQLSRPCLRKPTRNVRRKRAAGANLAILCAVGVLIMGLLGISIYTGLQAFLENDLQRVTSNAALAGASAFYSAVDATGKPTANPTGATTVATQAFNDAVANSSLKGFGAALVNVASNNSNDSVTVSSTSTVNTSFLSVVGINAIQATARATARALKYEPTQFTGPISILPQSTDISTYGKTLQLAFPLVDGPGSDLYVEQDAALQQGYVVEACDSQQCYNLAPGATPVGTSKIVTQGGARVIYGTVVIDLAKAGVRKGDKLRFTHANQFDSYNQGVPNPLPVTPTPLVIKRVMLFGYAGTCVDPQNCVIPAGFVPVE